MKKNNTAAIKLIEKIVDDDEGLQLCKDIIAAHLMGIAQEVLEVLEFRAEMKEQNRTEDQIRTKKGGV